MMDLHTITHNLGGYWRNGRGQAPCPVCQPERRRDQNALSLSQENGKALLHCFKLGCSFVEIASAAHMSLDNVRIDLKAQREHERKQAAYAAEKRTKARNLWNAAKPITGTKAEAYLRGRGITCDLPESLRFVPDIYHQPSDTRALAMVADVQSTGGIHRTYFDKQGNRLQLSAKMMLGPCAGGAVRLSEGRDKLVVCEGIETGLSLMSGMLSGAPAVWATLSTSGMKTLSLPQGYGKVVIATDGDPAGRDAGQVLMKRAIALGWKVSLLPAPGGMDWNDVLMKGVSV